jgi:hypothetical protein
MVTCEAMPPLFCAVYLNIFHSYFFQSEFCGEVVMLNPFGLHTPQFRGLIIKIRAEIWCTFDTNLSIGFWRRGLKVLPCTLLAPRQWGTSLDYWLLQSKLGNVIAGMSIPMNIKLDWENWSKHESYSSIIPTYFLHFCPDFIDRLCQTLRPADTNI